MGSLLFCLLVSISWAHEINMYEIQVTPGKVVIEYVDKDNKLHKLVVDKEQIEAPEVELWLENLLKTK